VSLEDLARRASSALVQTDDAVKTSEQELGFARAQFGDEASREFETALASAKAQLDEAFSLKQKLDDETPDSDDDARLERASSSCATRQRAARREGGGVRRTAQARAERPRRTRTPPREEGERGRAHDAAAATLTDLTRVRPAGPRPRSPTTPSRHRSASRSPTLLGTAAAQIAAGNAAAAAVSIRAAEDAVTQAEVLQNAIARTRADLAQAETDAAALIADLETDIAAARPCRIGTAAWLP
jgi:hypothetical protein